MVIVATKSDRLSSCACRFGAWDKSEAELELAAAQHVQVAVGVFARPSSKNCFQSETNRWRCNLCGYSSINL